MQGLAALNIRIRIYTFNTRTPQSQATKVVWYDLQLFVECLSPHRHPDGATQSKIRRRGFRTNPKENDPRLG